jgi:Cullin family/Cullin protein neddylation domain
MATQKLAKIEMDFKIVSFTFWQVSPTARTMFNLFPQQVNTMQGLFSNFYRCKFNERVLVWLHNIGGAVVTIVTSSGRKELHVTKLQAFVCMLLNDRSKITLEEVKNKSLLPSEEVLLEIVGLVCSDVLVVENKSKKDVLQANTLQPLDRLMINPNAEKLRSHVKVKQMKPKDKEKSDNDQAVDNQFTGLKKNVLESTIMKILKSEKRAKFEELTQKTIALVSSRFSLNQKEMLEALQGLLNKEYIERDSYYPNVFIYSDSFAN